MKNKIITAIIAAFVMLYFFDHFFFKSLLVGTYYNVNYGMSNIAEIPANADTLVLFDDGSFHINYYGDGNYCLKYSYDGTKISLNYSNGVLTTSIYRTCISSPKISLDRDIGQYYERF